MNINNEQQSSGIRWIGIEPGMAREDSAESTQRACQAAAIHNKDKLNSKRRHYRYPEYPHHWAYRQDVADGLLELRLNAQVEETMPSDALDLFTSRFYERFGPVQLHPLEILQRMDKESVDSDFSAVLRSFASVMGRRLDAEMLDRWLELYKGIECDGKVLIRSNSAFACWQVLNLEA